MTPELPKLRDLNAGQSSMFTAPPPAPAPASPPAPAKDAPESWERESFTVTFKAAGIGPPPAVRMRRLLKAALRCYGLRATIPPRPDVKKTKRA